MSECFLVVGLRRAVLHRNYYALGLSLVICCFFFREPKSRLYLGTVQSRVLIWIRFAANTIVNWWINWLVRCIRVKAWVSTHDQIVTKTRLFLFLGWVSELLKTNFCWHFIVKQICLLRLICCFVIWTSKTCITNVELEREVSLSFLLSCLLLVKLISIRELLCLNLLLLARQGCLFVRKYHSGVFRIEVCFLEIFHS